MDFTGVWDVVSSPDFDEAYLRMEVAPYVRLQQAGKRIQGDYHIGLQSGELHGRLQGDDQVIFSFEGMDEMDPVDGRGTATGSGDRLTFVLSYDQSDEYTFECKRRQ